MRAKPIIGHFEVFLSGSKTWGPSINLQERADYLKIASQTVIIGTLVILCPSAIVFQWILFYLFLCVFVYPVSFVCRLPVLIWQIFLGLGGGGVTRVREIWQCTIFLYTHNFNGYNDSYCTQWPMFSTCWEIWKNELVFLRDMVIFVTPQYYLSSPTPGPIYLLAGRCAY